MTEERKTLTQAEYESRKKTAASAVAAAQAAVDEAELKAEFGEITETQLQTVRTALGVAKSRQNGVERAWARSQQLAAVAADAQRLEQLRAGIAIERQSADERAKAFAAIVSGIQALGKHASAFNAANQTASDALSAFMGTLDPHQVGGIRTIINDTRRERDVLNAALYEAGLWELFGIGAKDAWMRQRDSGKPVSDFLEQRAGEILRPIEAVETSLGDASNDEPEGD